MMARTTEKDRTAIIRELRDMLLNHKARGHDIDDVIANFDRVIARREREGLA